MDNETIGVAGVVVEPLFSPVHYYCILALMYKTQLLHYNSFIKI
jgi:hypothetical protein